MSRSITRIARALPLYARAEALAGPSVHRRFASTEPTKPSTTTQATSTPSTYPFNPRVFFPPPTTKGRPRRNLTNPKKGWSVIIHLQQAMRKQLDARNLLGTWFSSKSKQRIRAGSVLSVTSYTSPEKTATTTFSGILMGVHRSGFDTSIRLRNIVNKVGVEVLFKVLSPMIKEIRFVKLAKGGRKGGGLRDLRQSRPYYIRDRPEILRQIAGIIKNDRVNSQNAGKR